jgi:hypothetical protein
MKPNLVLALSMLAIDLQVASAQVRVSAPPKPTRTPSATACVILNANETGISQLAARISAAQIAYMILRADGDSTSSKLRQCEVVVLNGFERIGRSGTQEAAEAVVKLVLDPEMLWNFSDRSAIATRIATSAVGPLATGLLYTHRSESLLAQDIVSCEGAKTCM